MITPKQYDDLMFKILEVRRIKDKFRFSSMAFFDLLKQDYYTLDILKPDVIFAGSAVLKSFDLLPSDYEPNDIDVLSVGMNPNILKHDRHRARRISRGRGYGRNISRYGYGRNNDTITVETGQLKIDVLKPVLNDYSIQDVMGNSIKIALPSDIIKIKMEYGRPKDWELIDMIVNRVNSAYNGI